MKPAPKLLLSRRRFLLAAAGAASGFGALAYARKGEPQWLDVNTHALALPARTWSGPPLRVLHLSDLHLSPVVSLDFIATAIARGLEQKPDLICLTGDYITAGQPFDEASYRPVLARLAAAAPTFATLGNHDGGHFTASFGGERSVARIGALLTGAGINWLHNQTAAAMVRGRRVHVVGLGDWWCGDCQPRRAYLGFVPLPGEPVIALSHNPDSKTALQAHPWHLLLCGHTHGGQCGLPLIGPALAPVRDKTIIAGPYRYEDRWIHVTRGVGNLYGVRFACRPEVALLTLA